MRLALAHVKAATVYTFVYCSPPFVASNQRALAAKVTTGKVKPIPSHYSSELQTTVTRLLQVNPDLRPDVDAVFRSSRTLTLMLKEKKLDEMERKLVKWERHLEKRELELDEKERELKSKPFANMLSEHAVSQLSPILLFCRD